MQYNNNDHMTNNNRRNQKNTIINDNNNHHLKTTLPNDKKGSAHHGGGNLDLKGGGSLDTAQLLQAPVEATLANAPANRDFAVILKESPGAEMAAAEGRRYSELVHGNRDHQFGPPQMWILGAISSSSFTTMAQRWRGLEV